MSDTLFKPQAVVLLNVVIVHAIKKHANLCMGFDNPLLSRCLTIDGIN